MTNPLMNPRTYAIVTGFALAATALLGIVMSIATGGDFVKGFLEFDWTHNVLHVVLAAAALAAGFLASGDYAKMYAKVFGIVYVGLAVVGFVAGPDVLGFLGVHLEIGENLVHLLIGAWGILTGFFGTTEVGRPVSSARRA
jgi:FtsH-binding integral membrane protein